MSGCLYTPRRQRRASSGAHCTVTSRIALTLTICTRWAHTRLGGFAQPRQLAQEGSVGACSMHNAQSTAISPTCTSFTAHAVKVYDTPGAGPEANVRRTCSSIAAMSREDNRWRNEGASILVTSEWPYLPAAAGLPVPPRCSPLLRAPP